jgi:hypothetical protein
MHSWPDAVAPGLSEAIGRLRERGARFVRVDELERLAGQPAA